MSASRVRGVRPVLCYCVWIGSRMVVATLSIAQ